MPRRLFLALLLLVAAPMALLGWLSASATRTSQIAAKESLGKLLSSQLDDADLRVSQLFDGYAATLDSEFDDEDAEIETLRRLRRELPIVRQAMLIDRRGVVVYPRGSDFVGIDAAEVAASLPGLIDARPVPSTGIDPPSQLPKPNRQNTPAKGIAKAALISQQAALPKDQVAKTPKVRTPSFSSAWQQWYMADGAQIIYWHFREDGVSIGILLERSRWIADLIAAMPDAVNEESRQFEKRGKSISSDPVATPIGSVTLVDEAKRTIYRWGKSAEFGTPELVSKNLSQPLASWQVRLHIDPKLIPNTSLLPIYFSLGGIAVVLLAVGCYVLSSVQRQINDAKNRVSFAGQVSHELRTPLTNIRLYTELAESDLAKLSQSAGSGQLAKRLEVIDHESRRLQRLVSGVLEMIRPSGSRIGIRREPVDLCELVSGITEQFLPSFAAAGVEVISDCRAEQGVEIDRDIIEIVLVNLLGNVEKYASRGSRCWIECQVVDTGGGAGTLRILVADDGPGIPVRHRARVFRPFQRLDDSINAPSGTGIGLTIAQRAAQRHGGALVLLNDSRYPGAAFELTVPLEAP